MKRVLAWLRGAVGKSVVAAAVIWTVATEIWGPLDYGGEKIIRVRELPDNESFSDEKGGFLDLCYIYKQIHILWVIPVWNYDGRWCLNDGASESYYPIDKTEFDLAAQKEGQSLPIKATLPFWDAFGGKLTLLAAALLGILCIRLMNRRTATHDVSNQSPESVKQVDSLAPVASQQEAFASATYHVAQGGENLGEFTGGQINTLLSQGSLTREDYYFDTSRNEWVPLGNMPHLTQGTFVCTKNKTMLSWRKLLGWPVLLLGVGGLIHLVALLFTDGPANVEWKGLLSVALMISVGAAWIKGKVA